MFIGGGDKYFYAFDRKTGKEIWRAPVPYEETAVPMTYRTRSGKQFVVMATGESVGQRARGLRAGRRGAAAVADRPDRRIG